MCSELCVAHRVFIVCSLSIASLSPRQVIRLLVDQARHSWPNTPINKSFKWQVFGKISAKFSLCRQSAINLEDVKTTETTRWNFENNPLPKHCKFKYFEATTRTTETTTTLKATPSHQNHPVLGLRRGPFRTKNATEPEAILFHYHPIFLSAAKWCRFSQEKQVCMSPLHSVCKSCSELSPPTEFALHSEF